MGTEIGKAIAEQTLKHFSLHVEEVPMAARPTYW